MGDLDNIVRKAYKVFQKYRVTAPLDACTFCCITTQQEKALTSTPLNNIPYQLMYDYNTAAKSEKRSLDEVKYFLPRLIELTTQNKFPHHSTEWVFVGSDYFETEIFTEDESMVLQEFAESYFIKTLDNYPLNSWDKIYDVIIMLSKLKINLLKVLNLWTEKINLERTYHLCDLLDTGIIELNYGRFSNEILDNTVSNWVRNKEELKFFCNEIEKIIMQSDVLEESQLNKLSRGYDVLLMLGNTS